MIHTRTLLPTTLLAFALLACQQTSDTNAVDPGELNMAAANSIEVLPVGEDVAPPASNEAGNALNEADDSGSEDPNQAFIPAQYRGRWGMVPGDCTSTRGDNKGLITVGDTSIKFYEAVATLKEQRPAIATSFAGLFGVTGEGQTWERVMTFTRTGNRLKRADNEGNYAYTRCA